MSVNKIEILCAFVGIHNFYIKANYGHGLYKVTYYTLQCWLLKRQNLELFQDKQRDKHGRCKDQTLRFAATSFLIFVNTSDNISREFPAPTGMLPIRRMTEECTISTDKMTKHLEEKGVSVTLCPLQIPRGLIGNRNQTSEDRSQ